MAKVRILSREQKKRATIRWNKWYRKNRVRENRKMRQYRKTWVNNGEKTAATKLWYQKIKSKPCVDCGNCFPACCMDFDHREGTKKRYCVGTMVAHHYNLESIKKEADKCDLVCANCHRIRTRNRRTGKKLGGQNG